MLWQTTKPELVGYENLLNQLQGDAARIAKVSTLTFDLRVF